MVAPLVAMLIASVAGGVLSELVRGPLEQVLGGVMPHEDVAVRSMVAMYVAGGVTRDDFLKSDAISHLVATDQKVVIEYADYMRALKNTALTNAANKGIEKILNDLNSDYEKVQKEADDIELDRFTNAVNAEIQNQDVDKKPYESLFYSAAKRGEEAPYLESLKIINNNITELKQLIIDKRVEINNRKKAKLDADLKSLTSIQSISDILGATIELPTGLLTTPAVETLVEVGLNYLKDHSVSWTAKFLLELAGYAVTDFNIPIADQAIVKINEINPQPPVTPPAPTTVSSIKITVLDVMDVALSGANYTIVKGGNEIKRGVTTADGLITAADLGAAQYTVSVSKPGLVGLTRIFNLDGSNSWIESIRLGPPEARVIPQLVPPGLDYAEGYVGGRWEYKWFYVGEKDSQAYLSRNGFVKWVGNTYLVLYPKDEDMMTMYYRVIKSFGV
jgi:hypothetical protein